jgi:hypothetical protein
MQRRCSTLRRRSSSSGSIELRGKEQRGFLPFQRRVPSHGTLNGVLAALDPALFKGCFASCVESLRTTEPHVVAIDGKTSRRGPPSNPDRSGRGAGRMLAARIASHSTSYPPLRGLLAASRSGIGSMAP